MTGNRAFASEKISMLSAGVSFVDRKPQTAYSLKLIFSHWKEGSYLVEVQVEILLDKNKVASTTSQGPWLYVDLKPGDYFVRATRSDGTKQSTRFSISGGDWTVVILTWQ